MFTNAGRSIISKYLLGQTPAFASYIVIGCGAKQEQLRLMQISNHHCLNQLEQRLFLEVM